MQEPLKGLLTQSKLLVLDFSLIPEEAAPENNIAYFFEFCRKEGLNPRAPENRQRFNNRFLEYNNARYAISQYAENRMSMLEGSQIAQEGRIYHLGIDIFAAGLEKVYAPCSGEIIETGQEPEDHSFGYYSILKPDDQTLPFIFFGHLGAKNRVSGRINSGQQLGALGDFTSGENGGWSRHLHLQMLRDLPQFGRGPIGYSSKEDLALNKDRFPNPIEFFPMSNLLP